MDIVSDGPGVAVGGSFTASDFGKTTVAGFGEKVSGPGRANASAKGLCSMTFLSHRQRFLAGVFHVAACCVAVSVAQAAEPTVEARRRLVRNLCFDGVGVRGREHHGMQHGGEQSAADAEHGGRRQLRHHLPCAEASP